MKRIPLTKGQFALVDDTDYVWLSEWKWHIDGHGYAARWTREPHAIRKYIYMQNEIMGHVGTDHWNRNKLDNRRRNLRKATRTQNQQNRKMHKNNKSGFKGVCSSRRMDNPWRAVICIRGRRTHIGAFKTREQAAHAYDEIAFRHFGRFAVLNFPVRRFPR